MKIGFIGLGHMGAPMALNLLKAGHEVRAFDLSEDALRLVKDGGAQVAASPREAAAGAEFVVTMLPAAAHVRGVLTQENGVLAGLAAGAMVIDSSTIDPASAQAFGELVRGGGGAFVDAPVSGGTGGAAAGTLTFMVGGSDADYARVKPVLAAMGKNIVHCGATGMGQVAKVCNNLVLGITMAGVSEAMALGASLGIDPKVLAGIINTSTGRCWSSDTYNPYPGVIETAPSSRGYTGGFGTDLMLKDLGLANDAAKQVRQPVYLGALAQQLYQTMSSRGDGKLDFSAVIRLYRPLGKDA
ncbi:3-hydroxyisobutyrate dehydrogenase [Burkholderia thailandensis]|uniref:3-hydroxyisobutyrate dehydrogenase n=2 Tax=Burkholderia thailandensis TaxID=57975 RepID=A0AAW9CU34_BURTH|nr:3-hydroxyisobutyrate dehydrogenase [Burkholderia thailandensis]ABC34002.1 3-hydroxyisobutyrate dehydrogenase [Burkholderia thailandensis E264]AHI67220.1 3-hydroxyisobutyrate dehydrogenase [Burkholderia thailandensis H0587]AHI76740.1 3-hydroxyisobutyrate dehydrogenase [Burkholderia thailandensis 2002721723]AHI81118.1 3-hydroxyisobutyrate dehydrogenase [Burkholderia thailandensis E444]AIC89910.1 3-hydroxyisobutyrate dehydrogenase [Burkholderia thailandensis USAMRU Malaysia \